MLAVAAVLVPATTVETLVVLLVQVVAVTAPVDIVTHKAAGVHLTTAVEMVLLTQVAAVAVECLELVVLVVQVL
jgi:hypothetical protein